MKHVISCMADGTMTQVQNDDFPLHEIGESSMERASDVFWDEPSQKWVAVIREKFWQIVGPHEYAHKSRSECIKWEIEYLQRGMK